MTRASPRRFPWIPLLAMWLALAAGLTWVFWTQATTGAFDDADDYMRMLQVRDLLSGQSWFDLTQHRIAPPGGLAMHWSRLVDLPLVLVIAPLTPIFGQHAAEAAGVTLAPLLTLLTIMMALAHAMRRLFLPNTALALLACLLMISAPSVLVQVHPSRIDHHGWQIAFATIAFAALLERDPRRSGIIAGIAVAVYLAISIEGAPFAVAALGSVALLWALGRESGVRLNHFIQSLGGTAIAAFILTAPALRWTENKCDAITPSHLLAFVFAAGGVALAVRVTEYRGACWKLFGLTLVALVTGIAFAAAAPDCVGSPFGTMDPLVHRYWYGNVVEGLPFWRQTPVDAVRMVGFPIIGLIGALPALRRAKTVEAKRRWLLVTLLIMATFLTGALVRRAAGIAHVIAIPGAFVLIESARAFAERRRSAFARSAINASAIFGLSPLMPIYLASFAAPSSDVPPEPVRSACNWQCGLAHIATLPPSTLMTGIDLAPAVLAATRHSTYAAAYHRLQVPLHNSIAFFLGPETRGEAFMRARRLRYLLVAPLSDETNIYIHDAPDGLMARLVAGRTPDWLIPIDTGSPQLKLYRLRG